MDEITLMSIRKHNSKRPDSPCLAYIKQTTRHYIETVFSQITLRFPKGIHAVTFEGFLLKVSSFIWVYSLEKAQLALLGLCANCTELCSTTVLEERNKNAYNLFNN